MKDTLLSIKELSKKLLKEDISKEEIQNTIHRIYDYFKSVTAISGYDKELKHLAAIPTASGMALGLNHAALCLLDYHRTYLFFKGVMKAIEDKRKEHPTKIIQFLYAGCGPYAPFVNMVAPLFSADEVQFSLLDINQNAINFAKQIIADLSLENYINNYFVADAITFKIPNNAHYDIVFSETLDALLYRESYVPILGNLLSQLNKDVKIIPHNVIVNFKGTYHEVSKGEELIDTIFYTRDSIEQFSNILPPVFPAKEIEFDTKKNYKSVIIDTLVNVYDDIWIKRGESSLTLPYEMIVEQPISFKKIIFNYQIAPSVELKLKYQ
ncbi:phytanoyl-CoA dioxygenase [Wenyingzhuangia sp. IMCC45533]